MNEDDNVATDDNVVENVEMEMVDEDEDANETSGAEKM